MVYKNIQPEPDTKELLERAGCVHEHKGETASSPGDVRAVVASNPAGEPPVSQTAVYEHKKPIGIVTPISKPLNIRGENEYGQGQKDDKNEY